MKRFLKIVKRGMLVLLSLLVLLSVITFFYMRQAKFGSLPRGTRLARIEQSPNYRKGRFVNQVERPTLTEGYSMMGVLYQTLFGTYPRRTPEDSLPSVKTDLRRLPPRANLAVWFGHSSVYLQLGGKKFLVDPVFSGNASPLPGSVTAFKGSDVYTTADMPDIDYLVISHDHYDHLDYETVTALRHKVRYVICGLGVGAHFERWGYTPQQIIEKDWYEAVAVDSGFVVHTLPAHHEGGRGFTRGQSLWLSFLIKSPGLSVYYSGDGGYDPVFKETGARFGPVDFALMECGQYNVAWQSVHKLPEEVRQATLDIGARRMLPVHHSKFRLANHPWDEPLSRIAALSEGQPYSLATPLIGQVVDLEQPEQVFPRWWEKLR